MIRRIDVLTDVLTRYLLLGGYMVLFMASVPASVMEEGRAHDKPEFTLSEEGKSKKEYTFCRFDGSGSS